MRRFSLYIAAVIFAFGLGYSHASHAGILDVLFPSLREEEYDPAKEMVAPFATEEDVEGKDKLSQLPINDIALEQPHRVSSEIAEWIMTVGAEAMNFEAGNLDAQVEGRGALFDTTGQNQFIAFLNEKNIAKVVNDGRYNVRSYVDKTPLLLNEGVVNDRYRWLFRVPVVVSYMEKNMKSYKNAAPVIVQKATLNVQIGRVASSADKPDGLQIEQWSGTVEPL